MHHPLKVFAGHCGSPRCLLQSGHALQTNDTPAVLDQVIARDNRRRSPVLTCGTVNRPALPFNQTDSTVPRTCPPSRVIRHRRMIPHEPQRRPGEPRCSPSQETRPTSSLPSTPGPLTKPPELPPWPPARGLRRPEAASTPGTLGLLPDPEVIDGLILTLVSSGGPADSLFDVLGAPDANR